MLEQTHGLNGAADAFSAVAMPLSGGLWNQGFIQPCLMPMLQFLPKWRGEEIGEDIAN